MKKKTAQIEYIFIERKSELCDIVLVEARKAQLTGANTVTKKKPQENEMHFFTVIALQNKSTCIHLQQDAQPCVNELQ